MARAKLNDRIDWFPCYAGNLLGALHGMPPDEGYLYTIVLLRIYENWGPCRDTIDALTRRTGITRRKTEAALASLISSGRLVQTADGITSPKATAVMSEQERHFKRMRERASTAGKKSAEKRQQNQPAPPTSGSTKPNRKEEKRNTDSLNGSQTPAPKRVPVSDWPVDYQQRFWTNYPRKTEKKAALAKLDAIKKSGSVPWATFMAGVLRHAAHVRGTEERYIKHPTTWLNRGCWDDQYGPRRPEQKPQSRNGFAAAALELNLGVPDDDDESHGHHPAFETVPTEAPDRSVGFHARSRDD